MNTLVTVALGVLALPRLGVSQAALDIYTDHMVNGFQDWSWASRDSSNSSPTHSGTNSIRVSDVAWKAVSFWHEDFDDTVYGWFSFWAHGGTGGGQRLQVYAEYGTNRSATYVVPGSLPAGAWIDIDVPLSALGVAGRPDLNRIAIQLRSDGTTNTFYVDAVRYEAAPAPTPVHLSVDAGQALRSADARWFGANSAVWDGDFDTPETVALLSDMGLRVLRFPGGSFSDRFHWRSNYVMGATWQGWPTWFTNFAHVATNLGAQAFITVNYGTGTPEEAADWVRFSNQTNGYGFNYWEIGNECYGSWEMDSNSVAHDPYTYAVRARDYIQQMKAADQTIRVGVVVAPGEDSFSNNAAHPVVNPRTGQTHCGWTPVLLATLKSVGVRPDFAVHHFYPQHTPETTPAPARNCDALLLQASTDWAAAAADLRRQIEDYFGEEGTNIELVVTENNSNTGAQGRQSTSLVNGLYFADSLAQLMKTEFNGFVWWDLRNGTSTNGSFDATLYGWRSYGTLGMFNVNEPHPAFYAFKLMHCFVQPGDLVLEAASDYSLLSAYAARHTNGALSMLVINKDATIPLTGQITLSNFVPSSVALVRSYGIEQDEAARTNGPAATRDLYTNSIAADATFSNSFPPYSLTLLTFAPGPPQLRTLPSPPGQIVFQLQGQSGAPYVIQTSPDLQGWTSVSTNFLGGGTIELTNVVEPGQRFWRALWEW